MKSTLIVIFSAAMLFASYAGAHHSFAPYDVYNDSIEISGTAESWVYRNPHAILMLKSDADEGGCVWTMELRNAIWQRMELPTDLIKSGDEMVITGWPARNSSAEFLIGAFEISGQEKVVLQTSATGNSNPPSESVVVTRPVCED